jgi:hypothetical protein
MVPLDRFPWQRVGFALAALSVYGAGASWVVHRAGASYRASLARERIAVSVPAVVAVTNRPALPPAIPQPTAPVSTTVTAVPPAPPSPRHAEAKPTVASVSRPEASPQPVVDAIWNDPRVTKKWDIDHLTIDQETELGESLKAIILTFNLPSDRNEKPVGDKTSTDRVYSIGEQLLKKVPRKRKEIRYEFIVLDSSEPNAFSTPGGFIYVTEGLLLSIGQDEPHILQFVLAHEIAHVDEQHALKCLHFKKLWDLRDKMGTAEMLYRFVIPNAYYDAYEFDADRAAVTSLGMLGYGRYEKLSYLRKLQLYADANGFARGHQLPRPDADHSLLDNHIRAHVSAKDRFDAVKEQIEPRPAAVAPRK